MRLLPLALLLYDTPGGVLLYDWTLDADTVTISDGEHGYESLGAVIPMRQVEAFRVYDNLPVAYVLLSCGVHAWEGRLEHRQVTGRGLEITALGSWRAVSDYGPYTAFWSDSSTARWQVLTPEDISTAKPERFEADNNNRLYMASRNTEGFVNTDLCVFGYRVPDGSATEIVACQFRYELGQGTNWRARLLTRDASWGSGSSQWSLSGGIAVKTGVENLTFTGAAALTYELEATGGVTIAASTGAGAYLKITHLRIAAATTNRVNTTIAAGVGSTGSQSPAPGSVANMFVGQKLWIGSGATGEIVTVTAVGPSTFTAVFTLTHSAGVTVRAIVVYASEIVSDLVGEANSLNSDELSSSTAQIAATSTDREIEIFEDKPAQDVVSYLADEGDDTRYEVGVWEDRRLYFRERGSAARVWYTDAVELQLASTLDTLTNRAYAVYRAVGGGILRTAEADDDESQARYGIIRRGLTVASTTSEARAEGARDGYLAERSTITPRSKVVTEGLFDASGIEYPLWFLKAGDTIAIRNLPPTLGTSVDKIRRVRVARKEYDVVRDVMQPTPELELPGLDVLIARPQIKQARDAVKTDKPLLALATVDTI